MSTLFGVVRLMEDPFRDEGRGDAAPTPRIPDVRSQLAQPPAYRDRAKPGTLRCDNSPEYISCTLREWAERLGIRLEYIRPGKPQQNAYFERYNRPCAMTGWGQYLFARLAEVQDCHPLALEYNSERPNMGFGGITPKQKLALMA